MPVSLQLWVFKAAPEALEGGAALLVSTFQIFIALGSVLGGRVVDSFGTSAVMFGGGGTALVGLILVRLSPPLIPMVMPFLMYSAANQPHRAQVEGKRSTLESDQVDSWENRSLGRWL